MSMRTTALAAAIALAGATSLARAGAAAPPQVNYQIISQRVAINIAKDGSYTKTFSRVIEPMTLSGVEQVAQAQIAYPANFAKVKILKAYTETPGHQRIKVAPSAVFTQSTSSSLRAPFLSQGTIKNVIFPAVKPGSALHLKYVEHFERAYMPGIYAATATLAPYVRAKSVTISVTAPRSMPLYFHARGSWTEHHDTGKDTETITVSGRWSHVEFPPKKTAAASQYAPMAVISTAANWQVIAQAYRQMASTAIQLTPAIRQAAAKAAQGARGKAAVARIYHWIQQNIQTVNVDYHEAGYQPPKASSTLARGIGDSNASVALLCSMLHAQGIKAVPALISTSQRYVPYPGADPFAFEHVLAYVPAYDLYLDTGERYAGLNALPLMDAGKPVLIAGGDGVLARTPAPERKQVQYREVQTMTLGSDGVITGTSQITAAGWRAIGMRKTTLGDRSGQRLQRFVQNGYYQGGHTGVMQIAGISNRDDLAEPVSVKLKWRNSDAVIPGRQMALGLPTPGTISRALSPFVSQATRRYPSVLEPETIDEIVHLQLPAGFKPTSVPENQHLKTPFGSYSVSYHYANGKLDEERQLQITHFVVEPKQFDQLHRLALMAVSTASKGLLLQRG